MFLSEMKFVVSEDKIGLAKNYLKEIRQLATSGKKVAQGTVIAQYLFAKKRYASLRASSAGYVYWLTFEKSTTTSIENYKYISRSNDIALAVISSSSKENVDDIVKFVEKTCKQPIRL